MTKKISAMGIFATLLANPVLLVIILILAAIAFIVVYVTLVVYGLVSALIYGLFGLGFVFIVGSFSKEALEKHWWIILIIPVLFIFGWFSDHIESLGLSWLPMIRQNVVFASNAWVNGAYVTVYGPYFVAVIMLILAMLALCIPAFLKKK